MEALMDDIKGFVLLVPGLQSLIDLLREDGWTVVGPTVRDGVVVHAEIASVDQLPRGVGDLQDGGSYRLRQRGDEAMFGYVGGPQGWKSLLFPAREVLWSGRRVAAEVEIEPGVVDAARLALLGVRSCDLHAIGIHDTVLAKRAVPDTAYVSRRQDNFIVAVTCSDPGGTCFCVSMGTGPVPDKGFDLALTELLDQDGHRFLVVPGSDRGAEVLD
jgi:sulfhydrogenase subunit beta (sulfur reductase)